MAQLSNCIHLYIGCKTNKGVFTGIIKDTLFIQTDHDCREEYSIENVGNTLFLYLQPLRDLTEVQSKTLINKGLVIGRPHGYTFSNNGFIYLLSLGVDLFGLIDAGYAKTVSI